MISGKAQKGTSATDRHVISVIHFLLHGPRSNERLTEDMVYEFIGRHPEMDTVSRLGKRNHVKRGVSNAYVLSAVFLALINGCPREDVEDWFLLLSSMMPKRHEKYEDQVIDLRKSIDRVQNSSKLRTSISGSQMMEMHIKCQHSIFNYCSRNPALVRFKKDPLWTYEDGGSNAG